MWDHVRIELVVTVYEYPEEEGTRVDNIVCGEMVWIYCFQNGDSASFFITL